MVLVAVDDLLFSSKIRTVAKLAGVDIMFTRTPAEILGQMRAQKPALVIFDLNSTKSDPINTLTAIKQEPDLGAIRTVGFVSHVDAATISAARSAGIHDLMPRSVFVAHLADILRSGQPQP